jgi:DNA-binding protein Fis
VQASEIVFQPRLAKAAPKPDGDPENLDRLTLDAAEKVLVERALRRCGGNQTAAAKQLGISRERLRRKLGGGDDG